MAWTNEALAGLFAEIAALLQLTGEDRFRVRAYERAADAIRAAGVDIANLDEGEIAALKGVGASTARKVREYLDTGSIRMLEDLRAKVPAGVQELTRVPGLGPKTAVLLHRELGVDSLEALRAAIDSERLRDVSGLGAKTEANLRAAIERMGAKDTHRVPAADALPVAEELCRRLGDVEGVRAVAYAGSLRRLRETVGDIDVLVSSDEPALAMAAFREGDLVTEVLAAGEKKTSVLTRTPDGLPLQADLRVVEPVAWGAALVYFTGSKAHNIRVRERAVRRGLTLNEYGLFVREGEDRVASETEEDVYAALDLPWIPPPMREDTGEVEAAAAGDLPPVVTVEDIRGDLHGHSDWSGDGRAGLEEMVAAAAARGYEYWAVTDHAENLRINGIDRQAMLARRREIERIGGRYDMRILDGAELNIGIDGSLDYDDAFLRDFDFCVASVHSHMSRGVEEQTARIVRAMEHPAVHVVGHPTGRKIGKRPGYEIDVDAVLEAAVRTGTALEVNANPRRLDLSGELVRRAVDAGALLAISTDAHRVVELDLMRYGVATAGRGWATPDDVLNCRGLAGLLDHVESKRS